MYLSTKKVFLNKLPFHCLRRLSPHRFGIEDLRISIALLPAVSLGWPHVHATIKWQKKKIDTFFAREFWHFSYYDQWPFLFSFKVTDALVKKIGWLANVEDLKYNKNSIPMDKKEYIKTGI